MESAKYLSVAAHCCLLCNVRGSSTAVRPRPGRPLLIETHDLKGHADRSVLRDAAGIWAHRPHGEPQLPFLGRKKKHDTKRQQAEDKSDSNQKAAHQHHSFSLWRLLSCMPAVGLEDKMQTEENGQDTDMIPARLPALRSSSDGASVGGS